MVGYILLIAGLVGLSGSAFAAFCWAVNDGQLNDLQSSAEVIFDEAEPIGQATDHFPES